MRLVPAVPLAAAALLAACSNMGMPAGPTAVATLGPTLGNAVSGTVYFTQKDNRVLVSGEIRGLPPNSEHGFHVHEKGDCSASDAMSASGHFNPGNQPHGRYDMAAHHAGDIPSVRADASGVANINFETTSLRLGSGHDDIVGRAVVVHRDPDDYTSQPAGNSGPRVACGVIRRS